MARQVTLVGPDASGFSWTCGQCGTTGTAPTSEQAMTDFNLHWDTAVIPPVDPWLGQLLDAGQGLADATGPGTTLTAWQQALDGVPAAVSAAWLYPNDIHPAG